MAMIRSTNDLLRELPSIDSLLRTTTALSLQPLIGAKHLGALARRVTDELRHEILADSNLERSFAGGDGGFSRDSLLEEAERRLAVIHYQESIRGLSHVINATGVILHTNLGRASLSEGARRAMLEELVGLAHDAGLLLYEDAGSGALIDFSGYGIEGEPVIRASIEAGADVVSFSGDKLLGGPQAGCVAGRAATIERMRSHPLYRALRAAQLRLAALEATLEAYARGTSVNELPTHRAIACTASEIRERANDLINRLHD